MIKTDCLPVDQELRVRRFRGALRGVGLALLALALGPVVLLAYLYFNPPQTPSTDAHLIRNDGSVAAVAVAVAPTLVLADGQLTGPHRFVCGTADPISAVPIRSERVTDTSAITLFRLRSD